MLRNKKSNFIIMMTFAYTVGAFCLIAELAQSPKTREDLKEQFS